jgi:hypothetical protein
MSLEAPSVAIVFGSLALTQGDVVAVNVHLGCTKEVSSYEVVLQNWSGKYSPNGPCAIIVGSDGSISVGRGASCPLLLTCRVENLKYQSSPVENYLTVSGRCWGERLFRRVITKTYENKKGEEIVKDLLDYYVGLSHQHLGTELVEPTDTTYNKLEYNDTPVIDVLQEIASSSDKSGVIGFDFRVSTDGKFEFFQRNSKTNAVSLSERIEQSEYSRDILRVRNSVTVYGAREFSVPYNKDLWTENLTCNDGYWIATSGTVSQDTTFKITGVASVKTVAQNLYSASSQFTLNSSKEVDTNKYPVLNFWLSQETTFNGNVTITLTDNNNNTAKHELTLGTSKWFQTQVNVGSANQDRWQFPTQFNWSQVNRVQLTCWFDSINSGSFWVDGLFFVGRQYSNIQNDQYSQNLVGLREIVEVNEELRGNFECECHAKALLSNLKDPTESLTVKTTVLDYGLTPILAGDKIHVTLVNEGIDGDFRVASAEYYVDAKTQTLEVTLELGRERPLLADYVYGLRSRTDRLSRYKLSKL